MSDITTSRLVHRPSHLTAPAIAKTALAPTPGGQTLVTLCNGVVQLLREFAGKGPSRCKGYWAGRDLLVILLSGGFTAAERTLFEAGHGNAVRDGQHALHEALELKMKALVEEVTERAVLAFMNASHQATDLRVELFVLEPDTGR
jgi:uncharacterized protein YbcI